jgi:hypothetical protein
MHLIDPAHIELSESDKNYLNNVNIVFNILCESPRQVVALNKIKAVTNLTLPTVYTLIRDSQEIYSKVVTRNAYFDKIMQRERILKNIEFCDKTNKIKEVALFENLLVKIDAEIERLTPEEKEINKQDIIPRFQFSSDPSVLVQASISFLNQEEE